MIRQRTMSLACAVIVLCVVSTLAGAATMVCTQEQETVLSSPAPSAVRKDCIMARGADGKEVAVNVPNTRKGDRVECTMAGTDGKLVCK
jgi:hypothetical protein